MMEARLTVSPSPHVKGNESTRRIMLDVVIALLPALVAGVVFFGIFALYHVLITVASAVFCEYVCRKIMKRNNTIGDMSAVVTGILVAFNLPVAAPLWMGALGGAIAIIVVKQFFGGLGQNFMNPALVGRVVLLLSFPTLMTKWTAPLFSVAGVDALSSATPLAVMNQGGQLPPILDMLLGARSGCIGEASIIALLIGAVYLLVRRVISIKIPLFYIATVALFTFLVKGANAAAATATLYSVLSGGLVLGAFFMATDYATSPLTGKGKIIFAIGCGIITAAIRLFGNMPEGVSFSILLMNILVPYIDKITLPKAFGGAKK
jgi:electron transport complex protein RnfD